MLTFNPTPSSNNAENLSEDQSSMKDDRFGGHREYSQTANDKDYTGRAATNPNAKKNPQDTTIDVDDLENVEARKREFSRRDETADCQKSNESDFITKTDKENQPLEEKRAFEPDPDDPNFLVKKRGSKVPGHFGDGQYNNNPNRGYEGEVR